MSEQKTIVVAETKKVASGSGKRGPWSLYVVKDKDGIEYKTFSMDIGTASAGDAFTVEVSESEYKGERSLDIKPVSGSKKQEEAKNPTASQSDRKPSGGGSASSGGTWGSKSPAESKQIRRAALMHDASAIVAAVAPGYWPELNESTVGDMAEFMLQLAEKLEKWVGA